MPEKNILCDQYEEVASTLQGVAHEINNPLAVHRTITDNVRELLDIIGGERGITAIFSWHVIVFSRP